MKKRLRKKKEIGEYSFESICIKDAIRRGIEFGSKEELMDYLLFGESWSIGKSLPKEK